MKAIIEMTVKIRHEEEVPERYYEKARNTKVEDFAEAVKEVLQNETDGIVQLNLIEGNIKIEEGEMNESKNN